VNGHVVVVQGGGRTARRMLESQEDLGGILADAGIDASQVQQRHRPVFVNRLQGGPRGAQALPAHRHRDGEQQRG
jgi:hypothetical protein